MARSSANLAAGLCITEWARCCNRLNRGRCFLPRLQEGMIGSCLTTHAGAVKA